MKRVAHAARDSIGVFRACDGAGVGFTFEREWAEVFRKGDVGAAGKRTWSKGSARGEGPQVRVGYVRRRGGEAEALKLCAHGQRAAQCSGCSSWHCGCPGSAAHVCREAA